MSPVETQPCRICWLWEQSRGFFLKFYALQGHIGPLNVRLLLLQRYVLSGTQCRAQAHGFGIGSLPARAAQGDRLLDKIRESNRLAAKPDSCSGFVVESGPSHLVQPT